jgi:hypothetical protein
MKISEIIKMLEAEMAVEGDDELMIYNSDGENIEPKSFSYGAFSGPDGFVNTITFSDVE